MLQAVNSSSVIFPALIQAKRRLYSRRYSLKIGSSLWFSSRFCAVPVLRQGFLNRLGLPLVGWELRQEMAQLLFYCDYLTVGNCTAVLSPMYLTVLCGTVQDTENRICRPLSGRTG